MASNRLSAESVLGTLFEDEFSLDESDSEDGEDVYGYLGEHVLRRNEIEAESRLLDEDLEEDLTKIVSKIRKSFMVVKVRAKDICVAMRKLEY